MILFKGEIFDTTMQDELLNRLEKEINQTRKTKQLDAQTVISALEKAGQMLINGDYIELSKQMDTSDIESILPSIQRENLELRLKTELGAETENNRNFPLGTLLHISAGNADGLPAMSVVEGLLTGNVNILKLPQNDSGLSTALLLALIEIEPKIAEFIYIFDTPSSDKVALKTMAEMSDGIVVWGGDSTISAVRNLAPAGCKLIEWGHKLSFAYISGYAEKSTELQGLARHIASTKQLLCSSCQTIFIDTDSDAEVENFCTEFLLYLDSAVKKYMPQSDAEAAEITILRLNDKIENFIKNGKAEGEKLYQGERASLTIRQSGGLEISFTHANVLVKKLPKDRLFDTLRGSKNHLQTAGLICCVEKRAELTEILLRSGVTTITDGENMSTFMPNVAHDGEYALRRLSRVVKACTPACDCL